MKRLLSFSLVWYNLTRDWTRLALSLSGITFAVVLIFIQLGFYNALMDSTGLLIDKLKADLLVVSSNQRTLILRETFSRHRLEQAASLPDVKSVHALYIDYHLAVLRPVSESLRNRYPSRGIRVLGVDPDNQLLEFPELADRSARERLKVTGAALFDRKGESGPQVFGVLRKGGRPELNQRTIQLVGSFELGVDLGAEGTLLVSEETFHEWLRRPYFPGWSGGEVEIGLVVLQDKDRITQAKAALEERLAGEDVRVLTRPELKSLERSYWDENTPIAFTFQLGVGMAVVVGLFVCFQILSGNVNDLLPQYMALLAMGYHRSDLRWLVLQEALLLGLASFICGTLVSWALYFGLRWWTGLPMHLTLPWVALVMLATLGMCVLPGLWVVFFYLRKVDPSELLK